MPTSAPYKRIDVQRESNSLIVRLKTGRKANAFCTETIHELTSLAREISEDMSISAVILTGQPELFSGGMDLNDPKLFSSSETGLQDMRRAASLGAKMCRAWEEIEAMTIAAIEGPCVGAGVALSLAADLRICAQGSILYVPEIERGMNMSWQSVPRSVNLIGPAKTKRMFILTEKISAYEALDWGWADYVVDSGDSLPKALSIAADLSRNPPISMRMCKQAINVAANSLNQAVSYMDADQLVLTQFSDDFREGINAFIEKRAPEFHGR